MEFARTHKGLMLWALVIDLAALVSMQWAPFDGFPRGTNLPMQIAGALGFLISMAGYLFASLIGADNSRLVYLPIFVVNYIELVLVAIGINKCRKAIRRVSPL